MEILDIIDTSIYKNIDIKTFQKILDESLTTSYKILWFKGILEEIEEGRREILFEDIVIRMIVNAWFPIVQYKLSFGKTDKIKDIIEELVERFNITSDIKKDKLLELLQKNKFDLKDEVKKLCRFVPFRLLSPFYKSNLKGTDYEKQKQIEYLNSIDEHPLYRIDFSNNKIRVIDDEWFCYLYSNQKLIKEWSNYKYINYLQRKNLSIPAIPFKLDFVTKRELSNATKVWKTFLQEEIYFDIYTREKNSIDLMSLDHYIPWSFVLHDALWNLVPTLKNINSSKNDKLPNLDETLDLFCELQFEFVSWLIKNKGKYKKVLEEYLDIDINILDDNFSKIEFIKKLRETIIPLHQIANNQGFEIWESSNYIDKLKEKEISKIEE